MSKRILELEKNTWIQAYQEFWTWDFTEKVPWILSKHINCYYDSKAMGIFNHCMSEKRYFAKSKAMIVQKFRFGAMLFVMLFVFKALIFITYVVIMCAIFLVSIYPICAIPKM